MPQHDVAIVGAGPAGMALALALHDAGRAPLLIDARRRGAARDDPRILALSHGSRQILERLGVWAQLRATPITTIHISQRGGFGRTLLSARDHHLPALGYVQEAGGLATALERAIEQRGLAWREVTRVTAATAGSNEATLSLNDEHGDSTLTAQLVAYAEGGIQAVQIDKDTVTHDYGQHAVLTTATASTPQRGIAYERFTPDGPLALLPYGDGYAVVFTAAPTVAAELGRLDDAAFLTRLQRQFGERLHFESATPRAVFPLVLRYRREAVASRQVWLGNSAQTLHPVAGQGFNLALRDIWELATVLRASDVTDSGALPLLRRYAAARRLDRGGAIGFTDALIRIFSNDNPLLRAVRGAGLFLLDVAPPARDFVARRMIFGARAWP